MVIWEIEGVGGEMKKLGESTERLEAKIESIDSELNVLTRDLQEVRQRDLNLHDEM
jgi:archaellum component FlaC